MKKTVLVFFAFAVLFVLVSASVWEGMSAVSVSGELPENGLYVATNSFPVNTVVDVTNIENGKTIRLTVSSGLDTPGLLALVSKEAANAIDLQSRTLGRIRMTQPADPIAFSRFSGIGSGDPDHDPAAFAALSGYDSAYWETLENANAPTVNADSGRVEGGNRIVDLPRNDIPAASYSQPERPPTEVPAYREPAVPPVVPNQSFSVVIIEATEAPAAAPAAAAPSPVLPGPDYNIILVPSDTRPPENTAAPDSSYFIAGISPQPQQAPADISIDPLLFIDPVPETAPAREIDASLFINPIPENAPPQETREIDASLFVDPIPEIVPSRETLAWEIDASLFVNPIPENAPPQETREIDASLFVDPIPEIVPSRETLAWEIDPSQVIDPIPEFVPVFETPQIAQPDIQPNVQPDIQLSIQPQPEPFFPAPYRNPYTPVFSAPLISRLERGKYYLQIAAFSTEEMVSSELTKIDRSLPVAVMSAGNTENPVYRILIGPVNFGESGALLQRFKGSYKDAFVRLGSD
jgi:hypothetical protein